VCSGVSMSVYALCNRVGTGQALPHYSVRRW
jgi:hypothetical protein